MAVQTLDTQTRVNRAFAGAKADCSGLAENCSATLTEWAINKTCANWEAYKAACAAHDSAYAASMQKWRRRWGLEP
jgi:hypothetical protein